MYSLLSAIASFFVQPAVWLVTLAALSLWLRPGRWRTVARWALAILAVVFSNPWLYHRAMQWWEPAPLAIEALAGEPWDEAIVLGGFTRLWAVPTDRLHLNGDGNRFLHAVELYHLGRVGRLIFVSCGMTDTEPPMAEADLAARTAERLGVPRGAIVALNTSRNTHENAAEYRDYLDSQAEPRPRRLLLVTSAFHARRSMAAFAGQGLEVTLFPTDHRTGRDHAGRRWTVGNTILPSPGTVLSWGPVCREWLGLVVYRLRGWI